MFLTLSTQNVEKIHYLQSVIILLIFRKCPYNCETCNFGTTSLPHLKDHMMLHKTGASAQPHVPAARIKHRKSLEPARTTRARSTEERRRSESAVARKTEDQTNEANKIESETVNDNVSKEKVNDVRKLGTVRQKSTVQNDKSESSMDDIEEKEIQENNENGQKACKIMERRGSGRGRGRGRPRRSSLRSSGRVSPRSPGRCSPRSPGQSPARAASVTYDDDLELEDETEMTSEIVMDTTENEANHEPRELEKAESSSRSPRSRCRTRKISKTVAAELANNTAIEHEEESVVPAKRPRRRSTPIGVDEQDMKVTGTREPKVPLHQNVIDTEHTSDAASFDMTHDDEEEDENEDEELDDVDQHIDTSSCSVSEDSVVKCKFCPFTVQAGDEKAQLNLRKHEQYHFRKLKYSCKHCTYSSGRLLVIKKHLEVLHADLSGLVIQKPMSSVKFHGKKIKMSFSFIKKNAFFKPLGLASRKALAIEKVEKDIGPDSKAHNHHTRAGGKRVSPRAKAMCPSCGPDGKGDGKRNHTCQQASGSDDDKIDVGEETNENADLDSTLSPASKRIRIEDTKQETLVVYGELGKKIGLKCHHCPFQLPWNHGVTSRMHAHEACHFRTSQFECTLCGWNGGNIIAARKHMVVHPEAKPTDLLKRWGKQFKGPKGTTEGSIALRRKASQISGRRNVAATNIEIIKSLTQKARIIKANTLKTPGKYGNNTVGALLQRKRDDNIGFKPVGKTIKEILNLKGENTQDSLPVQQMVSILSPTKDVAGSAKTVRALLDQSRKPVVDPSKQHVTKLTALTVPKNEGTNGTYLQCQYCPFKVRHIETSLDFTEATIID